MNDELCYEILQTLQRNRISTVEVADALNKTGVLPGLHPLNARHYRVGKVEYISTHSESNWDLHEQIQHIAPGCILFVDPFDCGERAVLGDIVSKYLFLYRRISGLVINGWVRDAHRLIKEDYPIWIRGVTPLGCFNKDMPASTDIREQIAARKAVFQDTVMICDDSGVTHIAKDKLVPSTLRRLELMELQEDIWYYCTDVLKWSTYDTICLKRYLQEPDVLPSAMRARIREMDNT